MIILSVGMPRAGSGWYYNLTNDLMLLDGAQDARQIRQRYRLQGILTEVNCNIGALTSRRLTAVMLPSMLGNTFVIKAHSAPTKYAHTLIRRGLIRPTYIYRDPRDALLSVMENGQKAIDRGRPNAFSPYVEFSEALTFIEEYLHIGQLWMDQKEALVVRYEDLLLKFNQEVDRLLNFLELDPKAEGISKVIERYQPEQNHSDSKGLHFSHGRIGRFRFMLSEDQQQQLQARLLPSLIRLGYET